MPKFPLTSVPQGQATAGEGMGAPKNHRRAIMGFYDLLLACPVLTPHAMKRLHAFRGISPHLPHTHLMHMGFGANTAPEGLRVRRSRAASGWVEEEAYASPSFLRQLFYPSRLCHTSDNLGAITQWAHLHTKLM